MPSTIHLHRVFTAPPEKVYRAFVEPEALNRWMAPNGFTSEVHHMNVEVGGTFKMSFKNFTTSAAHSFGGEYLIVKPNELLKYTDKFDDPNLEGEITVTVEFKKVSVGTELKITQAGIPDVIPAEMCYLGWQESLLHLKNLVEPDIKN